MVHRAERSDVTWAFLALLVGDPLRPRRRGSAIRWSSPCTSYETGAFLIFAFFMISDPKTTPDSRLGRILYAGVVAGVAAWIQFGLYRAQRPDLVPGPVRALVPAIDRCCPA